MTADPTDEDLLAAWRRGDSVAGSALVRRHFSTLYRFFRSRLDDDVPDLVQRTFLACVEARERIPPDTEFRVFALGIARNVLLMTLRKMGRRARVMHTEIVSAAASGTTPSGAVNAKETQQRLLAALRTLPLDLQLILELHYWEELKLADIGRVFEIPAGTVKSRLFRARRLLMEHLSGELPADVVDSAIKGLETWARELRAARQPPADA